MMTRTNLLHARTRALPAIAAALALSSAQALAQEAAQPVTSAPAPAATDQPAPTTDVAPTTDSGATVPQANDTSAQSTTSAKRTIKHGTHAAAAKPAPTTTKSTRTVSPHAAATPITAAAAAKPATAPAAAPAAPPPQPAASPAANDQPKPAPAQARVAFAKPLNLNGETLPIAGGALALLVVGGAAAAVGNRRRKRREQEWADAQTMAFEPFEETAASEPVTHEPQPETIAPVAPAFAWGNKPGALTPAGEPIAGVDDRRPGETWVERAYRGPTPNNPSVSLRNRLKRAAFFDKREREAAAGLAAPVNANAGLPGAMAGERELA
jgi:hypothetical protein